MATSSASKQKPVKASEIKSKKQLDSIVRSGRPIMFDDPYPQKKRRAKTPR